MSHDKTEAKMVYMANQIAGFFNTQPESGRQAAVANHINKFWEQRMRGALLAYVAGGGAGLDPLVLATMPMIKPPKVEA